jgi:hypothetical protein
MMFGAAVSAGAADWASVLILIKIQIVKHYYLTSSLADGACPRSNWLGTDSSKMENRNRGTDFTN